jgi:hypothetical protein
MGNKHSTMNSPTHKIQTPYDPVPPYDLEADVEGNTASSNSNRANFTNVNNSNEPIELESPSNIQDEGIEQCTRCHRRRERLTEKERCCFGLAYFSVACVLTLGIVFIGKF